MSRKKGDGSFVVRKNGRLEYKFCYEDEYGSRKRKFISGGSRERLLDCYS